MRACFLLLLLWISAVSAATVPEKIDQAIVLVASGRSDLAQGQLRSLLRGQLTSEERATVLYNLASLLAREDQYKEALETIGKIGPDLFEVAMQTSPILAASIAYDRALFALRVSKSEMEEKVQRAELESLDDTLDTAVESIQKGIAIVKTIATDSQSDVPSFPAMTHLLEEVFKQKRALAISLFVNHVEQLSKEGLIDELLVVLHNGYDTLSNLLMYDKDTLYVEAYKERSQKRLTIGINQLVLLLNASGSSESNRYFAGRIESAAASLSSALKDDDKVKSVLALTDFMSVLSLLRAQIDHEDMLQLLDNWIEAVAMQQLQPSRSFLAVVWRSQEQKRKAYVREYVDRWQQLYAKKEKSNEDVVALYALLDQEMAVIAKQEVSADQKAVAYEACALILATFQGGISATDTSFKSLVRHVESALSYQKRLIAFQDVSQQESMSLFIRWQGRMLSQILLLPELKKHKEAKEFISQANEILAPSSEALHTGKDLLEKAVQLLREQKEQSEESKLQSQQEAHQMQMEKKTLELSPEISIRLLQEMYRDDMSLEESQSRVSEGKRPW